VSVLAEAITSDPPEFHTLGRALSRRDILSSQERDLLLALPRRTRSFRRGEMIVEEHSKPTESCLLTAGFVGRVSRLAKGTQQITALHIPGDFVDLHAFLLKVLDHGIVAVSECKVAFVPHQDLLLLTEKSPHLGRLLWLSTVVDGSIHRAWITSLGRRSALEGLAHLICEIYARLEAVDLATDHAFEFPAIQAELSDMLGISAVHVNRSMQELRSTGLISWGGGKVRIHDYANLVELADFDPTYLNLINQPR
jgi:CRP-like cAMP-binding protein